MNGFKAAGLTRLIVDVTNNNGMHAREVIMWLSSQLMTRLRPGGFICLGHFLHEYLTGTNNLGEFQNP